MTLFSVPKNGLDDLTIRTIVAPDRSQGRTARPRFTRRGASKGNEARIHSKDRAALIEKADENGDFQFVQALKIRPLVGRASESLHAGRRLKDGP